MFSLWLWLALAAAYACLGTCTRTGVHLEAGVVLKDTWGTLPPKDSSGYEPLLDRLDDGSTLATPPGAVEGTQVTLKCQRHKGYVACDDPCTYGVHFGLEPGFEGHFYCYISSVLYHTYNCEQRSKKYTGRGVVEAAVKTCEAMGYSHQYLDDGARSKCMMYEDFEGKDYYWEPTSLDTGNSVFLRTSGLFTSGKSFYLKAQGFFPFIEGKTATYAMENWCDAAERAQSTTVGEATGESCLVADGGFKNSTAAARDWAANPVVKSAACAADMALGLCFRRLVALDKTEKSAASCSALTLTARLMEDWNPENRRPDLQSSSTSCRHRSQSVAVSMESAGRFRRFTHGFKVKHGAASVTVRPDTPLNVYCNAHNSADVGQECATAEMCKGSSKCVGPKGQVKTCCVRSGGFIPKSSVRAELRKHYATADDLQNEQRYAGARMTERPDLKRHCCPSSSGRHRLKIIKKVVHDPQSWSYQCI